MLHGVFAEDSLNFPSDLAFGPDGLLYVTNAVSRSIARFDGSTGAFVDIFGRLPIGSAPVGIDFGIDGRVFVADFVRSRLMRFPRNGGDPEIMAENGLGGPEHITVRR